MTPMLLTVMLCAAAGPEARKVAVLVGANTEIDGRGALRFAHHDAERFAATLVSVAGFAPADVHVLKDPEPEEVLRVLDARLAEGTAVVVFYFSGHADPQALYTAGKPLALVDVKQRLERAPAALRLGIVDACHGGGWTRAKGLVPVPYVKPVKLVASEGSALLASSSGLERAHESDALQGSFFTHHLIAALRGAAEQTPAGEVTLSAAFRYAEQHTVRDSALYAGEAQHPSFELNLRGRTDVVLAQIGGGEAQLQLAQREGPLQLVQLKSGTTLLELPAGERRVKLAVEPGGYLLRRVGSSGVFAREVTIEPGKTLDVDEESLTLVGQPMLAAKQPDDVPQLRHVELAAGWAMPIAGGGFGLATQFGIAASAAWRFDARWGVRVRGSWNFLRSWGTILFTSTRISNGLVTEALFGIDGLLIPLSLQVGTVGRFEVQLTAGTGAAIARNYRGRPGPNTLEPEGGPRLLFAPITVAPSLRFFFGQRVAISAEGATHWVPGAEGDSSLMGFIVTVGIGVTVTL